MKKESFIPFLLLLILIITQSCSNRTWVAFCGRLTHASILGGDSWYDPFGGQVGVCAPDIALNESMSFRVELNGSTQGAKYKEDNGLKGRVNLIYANLPVVLRYQTQRGFFGEVGLQPGLLLSAKDKYEGNTDNYMESMNKFDLSIPFGIGYEFKNSFGVGLRVIPGINDITKDEDEKDRNFVVALGITYTIRKK